MAASIDQKSDEKEITVGVDLGTGSIVMSSVSSLNSQPILITHGGGGEISLPSTIKVKGQGIYDFGVKERGVNVIRQIKRFFGARFDDVVSFVSKYPYKILKRKDGGCEIAIEVNTKNQGPITIKVTPFEVTVAAAINLMEIIQRNYSSDYKLSFAFSFPARFSCDQVNLFTYAGMYCLSHSLFLIIHDSNLLLQKFLFFSNVMYVHYFVLRIFKLK